MNTKLDASRGRSRAALLAQYYERIEAMGDDPKATVLLEVVDTLAETTRLARDMHQPEVYNSAMRALEAVAALF